MSVTVFLLLLQGCALPTRRDAVPAEFTTQATVPGIPDARFFADSGVESILPFALAGMEREKQFLARSGHRGPLPPVNFLAISGGGDNGAFGAGLLVGWTDAGNRPEFKLVTGISTGALIAPFAFLGPAYDDTLKKLYTTISQDDVLEKRTIFAAVFDDAMADNRPLWQLVSQYIDEAMLVEIANEYNKGRFLMIATTDLDARRPVIWNMGAIAASKDPKAVDLFRNIMVASAAIPGAFPPTMIDVEVDGTPYHEMHVDGGAMAQVFTYPPSLNIGEESKVRHFERDRTLYIIRNARLDPDWASVDRRTLDILSRTISSLIQTQGVGDLYQIYTIAQRDGIDYNLAYIGANFNAEHKMDFDTDYMRKLFDYAYQLAREGYPWQKYPPGFSAPASD